MVTREKTPAEAYADLLAAVAEHLRANPQLTIAGIYGRGTLQVSHGRPDPLIAWYRSLDVRDLHIDLYDGYAAVHALDVPIGSAVARAVWGSVEGLEKLLVQGGGYTRLPFTVGELEYFAAHGTLAGAGEPR